MKVLVSMSLSPNIRFSGGHIHLPGGERHIASFTAKGGLGEMPWYSALPEGLYDLDPFTMELQPDKWTGLYVGKRAGSFQMHTGWRGNGIRVSPYVRERLIALSRQRGSRGRLLMRVNYGNKMPWMKTARGEIGKKELSNRNDGARIRKYWSDIKMSGMNRKLDGLPTITATSTAVERNEKGHAWCGGFVAWVLLKNGHDYAKQGNADLKENPAGAHNWANFGVSVTNPTVGCIAVKGKSGAGHVGFVAGGNSDKLYILGGNQADAVNVMEQSRSLYHTFRLPTGYTSKFDFLSPFKGTWVASGSTR